MKVTFYLNNKKVCAKGLAINATLSDYLTSVGLIGTKVGDHRGALGADTIMLSHWDVEKACAVHEPVPAALIPLASVHGYAVTTIEGIGNMEAMHPIQQRWVDSDAAQCGFCSPGFIMSMYTLL
ncbi:hypothetical protein KIPB_013662, partial [Kipferlia bialata]|eukprot:g13662.t1